MQKDLLPKTLRALLRAPKPQLEEGVQVGGWITSLRHMKDVTFAEINDGSLPMPLTAVLPKSMDKNLHTGTCVRIEGKFHPVPHPSALKHTDELRATKLEVLGLADGAFPLQKKAHSREFLREMPELRLATQRLSQVVRYKSYALRNARSFFENNDVFEVTTPILTASDCEGAGETFRIEGAKEFFGKPVSLSVSSQLHLEVMVRALGRVYNVATSFRAEESATNRHLAEFTMIEAEFAYADTVPALTGFTESLIKSMLPDSEQQDCFLKSCRQQADRDLLLSRWEMLRNPWTSMTYKEAIEKLQVEHEAGRVSHGVRFGDSLSSELEKHLASNVVGGPTFVTDYPRSQKPFYMKRTLAEHEEACGPDTVQCFDLLFPTIGEVTGGSVREDDYGVLLKNMKEYGINAAEMEWYTNLRKWGSVPHGGFGVGFNRLVMFVSGLDNIREAADFIRHANHIAC